jgi:hypothetical protein
MSKSTTISWRNSQKSKLSVAVRTYNAQLTRAIKRNPEFKSYLPNKVTVQEIKDSIATRQDLSRVVRSLSRANKQSLIPVTSETGIKSSQYEIKEIKLKIKRINRIRQKELNEMNASPERGNTSLVAKNNLKPKKFEFDKIKNKDWDKFVKSVEKQASGAYQAVRADNYKQNYLEAIRNFLGADGNELYALIESMPADHVFKNGLGEDPIMHISFTSDPLPTEEIATIAYDHWLSTLV